MAVVDGKFGRIQISPAQLYLILVGTVADDLAVGFRFCIQDVKGFERHSGSSKGRGFQKRTAGGRCIFHEFVFLSEGKGADRDVILDTSTNSLAAVWLMVHTIPRYRTLRITRLDKSILFLYRNA